MVYTWVSKTHGGNPLRVRVSPRAPLGNSSVFWKPKCGTREARPKDSRRISQTNSEFLARLRALIFRQEAGSSQRFLWHRPFWQKGLNQKRFCPRIERLLANFGKVRANHSACVKERSFLLRATSWKVTILIFQYDNLVRQ